MKTNDIFNFRRFGKYFASDIRTCTANYGLSLLTISLLTLGAVYLGQVLITVIFGNGWDGPDTGLRLTAFGVAMFCLVVTMPVKCYGRITEKQYGSTWLMVPASRLEKVLSMLITTTIVAPLTGLVLFLGLDALICAVDPTCGNSLISFTSSLPAKLSSIIEADMLADGIVLSESEAWKFLKDLSNPLLYIDDYFGIVLPFLLGAVFFKNGKTVKTFIALFAYSTLVSVIMTPLIFDWMTTMDFAEAMGNEDALQIINESGILKNITLYDTLSDTIYNLALLLGIWFRIKTLKH